MERRVYCKNFTEYSVDSCSLRGGSDFQNDGKDQGTLGSLFVDVALEVDADFFLDDAPVGFFFGVGLFDRLHDDLPRAGNELVAVVAHQAARNDFRMRFHLAGMLIDRDDRHDDTIFGKMLSIADYDVFDFFERTGIHAHASGGYRIAPVRAFLGEFDRLAVLDQEDFAGHSAKLMRERGVAEKMPVFAVNGDEILRLHELQQEFLFFLACVTRNVNCARGIIVVDQRAAPEHVVQHPENSLFISGDDACRKNYAVVFVHGNVAMIVHGNARERRHGLGLAPARQNDDALRIEAPNVLLAHHHSVGDPQQLERVRDFHVINHATADERNFAVHARSNVNDLLNSVNGGSEARQDHAARRRAAQLLDTRNNRPLGWRETGALDVCRIAEEREHAFVAVFCERMKIKRRAADGRLVDLEVARVNDHAERSANRKRDAIDGAVRYGNEFNFIRSDFHQAAWKDFAERC